MRFVHTLQRQASRSWLASLYEAGSFRNDRHLRGDGAKTDADLLRHAGQARAYCQDLLSLQ